MIVSVLNLKGGVGKTTTAMALAAAAVRDGIGPVEVHDCDPGGSASSWAGRAEDEGGELGYAVVSANRSTVKRLANKVKEGLVIIDCPPDGAVLDDAMRVADLVVVPTTPSPADFDKTQEVVDALTSQGKFYGVLLTRVIRNTRALKATQETLAENGASVFDTQIYQREDLKNYFGHAFGDRLFGYEEAWEEISSALREAGISGDSDDEGGSGDAGGAATADRGDVTQEVRDVA